MEGRKNIISNMLWRFFERCGAQGVAFVVSIILARLLLPEDYGTIAFITVFTSIFNVFINCGLGNALIQKKDADDEDFSTVFYFNVAACCFLYLIFFLIAPLIAEFYKDPDLTTIMRVLGLTLVISGVKNVQQAYISKTMQFRIFFFATLVGTTGAAVAGISLAYCGFGVWALVAQQIVNVTVDTIVLWITVRWRPKRIFSIYRLKHLFSFGWKLLISSLLDTVYNNVRQLIIGKLYTSEDLAFYNRGRTFPDLIVSNINESIRSILFPVMSQVQDDCLRVRGMTRLSIKVSTYIMAPMMIGLACVSEELIGLLLTEKWIAAVPYMRIFCITFMFYPIHTANLSAIKAMGRSDLFLKLEIVKKVMGLTVLALTMWHGVMVMAYSLLFTSVLSQIINSWPNRKLLNYGYLEQLKDILPGILLAVVMGCCIYPVQWLGLPDIVTMLIQVPLGAVIYICASAFLKLESFEYLWAMLKPVIMKILKRGHMQ